MELLLQKVSLGVAFEKKKLSISAGVGRFDFEQAILAGQVECERVVVHVEL